MNTLEVGSGPSYQNLGSYLEVPVSARDPSFGGSSGEVHGFSDRNFLNLIKCKLVVSPIV
jgi:hypothetical protein